MHQFLYHAYQITKNYSLFHRIAAWLILHFEVPLIKLILNLLHPKNIQTIEARHSLLEPGGFNLFMSDIDLSIVVQNEHDINLVLSLCKKLKNFFPNIGEQEIYLTTEWKEFKSLISLPHHNVWNTLYQVRKLSWQREKYLPTLSLYEKTKIERGISRSLKALNSPNEALEAETIFPFLNTLAHSLPPENNSPYDEFLCREIRIGKATSEQCLVFSTEAAANLLRSLTPLSDEFLNEPWENLRIYLLKRELLMAKCHLRLLKWNQQTQKIPKIQEWVTKLDQKITSANVRLMMPTIEVILRKIDKPEERLSLYFKLIDTPIAHKYLLNLKKNCLMNVPVYEPDRTYNFPGDVRDNAWIAKRLNECIDIINQHSPVIKHRAQPVMDQEHMNQLHKYFEVYRGPILNPPEFFVNAPDEVKKALSEFNILIHRYEDYNRNLEYVRNGQGPASKIVLTFSGGIRTPLADEDYLQFSTRVVFGRFYLNYCEVGKPIWDMYQDNDEVVGEENILPLGFYSADAMIEFSPTCPEEVDAQNMAKFYDWWDRNKALMDGLGFTKYDPKNAIGHIPLADLDRTRGAIAFKNEKEIREIIGQYPIILGAQVVI